MSLIQTTAIETNLLLGLASLISGMFIGLVLGLVCWHFMRKADRTAKLSVLWLFVVWGALWIGQGLQEPIKHIVGG
jgi:NhaP-type Na+/H+ or K+/H+ antiporter